MFALANWERQLKRLRRAGPRLVTPTPRTEAHMSEIRNFAAQLAIAGKGFLEIKEIMYVAYGELTLQKTQI